jgi:hypothetical protein
MPAPARQHTGRWKTSTSSSLPHVLAQTPKPHPQLQVGGGTPPTSSHTRVFPPAGAVFVPRWFILLVPLPACSQEVCDASLAHAHAHAHAHANAPSMWVLVPADMAQHCLCPNKQQACRISLRAQGVVRPHTALHNTYHQLRPPGLKATHQKLGLLHSVHSGLQ